MPIVPFTLKPSDEFLIRGQRIHAQTQFLGLELIRIILVNIAGDELQPSFAPRSNKTLETKGRQEIKRPFSKPLFPVKHIVYNT